MLRLYTLGRLELRLTASDTSDGDAVVLQPKRLALLAYLATALPRGPQPRDLLLALFWPERDAPSARRALRQALYHLRSQAGAEAVVDHGAGRVGVDPAVVWCDAVALEQIAEAGDAAAAVARYEGDFLAGFHAAGASPELEEWIAVTRRRLTDAAARMAWKAAAAREAAGDMEGAERLARRGVELVPDDEVGIRRLAELEDRLGDRAGALRTLERHARRLREEFGAEPDPATLALAARLCAPNEAPVAVDPPAPPALPPAVDVASLIALFARRPLARRRMRLAAMAGLVVFGSTVWLGSARRAGGREAAARPVSSAQGQAAYSAGLRAYYGGDMVGATRLFKLALGQDTTLAQAAMFASVAYEELAQPESVVAQLRRARDVAPAATARTRALVEVDWAFKTNAPNRLELAESLAARYPGDVEADVLLARALAWDGRALPAIARFRAALVQLPAMPADSARCLSCEAYEGLTGALALADSLPAAVEVARAWSRAHPGSGPALAIEQNVLIRLGRYAEAWAVQRRLANATPWASDLVDRAALHLAAGAFAEADALLRVGAEDGNAQVRYGARWWLTISLRNQGRLREALEAARAFRAVAEDGIPEHGILAPVPEAIVHEAMGASARAAALYDSIGATITPTAELSAGSQARHRTWALARAAAARAAAGDTIGLERAADSLEVLGRGSGYGRDRRVHWHVRGLLAAARGHPEEAVPLFRAATFSPVDGYTRTQLDLGRTLLRLGRPREAAVAVAPALRGPHDGPNLYVTHAELHELLAQCHDAAGAADSARAHYAWVAAAWRAGDPPFRRRAAIAAARWAALGDTSSTIALRHRR